MDKKTVMKEVAKSIRQSLKEMDCKIEVRVFKDIAIEIHTFNHPSRNEKVIKIMDETICKMYPITKDETLSNNWTYQKDYIYFGIYYA